MRKFLILAASAAALITFAPTAPSHAQGITVDTPVGGVRIGEPRYRDHWRREHWREREVRGGGCRTVTITRDDGSFKRIRRCD